MIHTASLLHDDVIDVADTRRGVRSVNFVFGNKLAILAGDFLLARASVSLARLRNLDVRAPACRQGGCFVCVSTVAEARTHTLPRGVSAGGHLVTVAALSEAWCGLLAACRRVPWSPCRWWSCFPP
jgi:hypothetical protein